MIPTGEIVPAYQGFAVAAGTPIADISSSTDPMEEDQQRSSFVQVQNQTLNRLSVTADPIIVAEAHQEIARVRSEAQRVALLADSAVREANQRVAMVQGNSQAQVADVQRTAQERVELVGHQANVAVGQIQNEALAQVQIVQSQIQQMEEALRLARQENRQMKAFVEQANRKQREHAEIVESLHKERQLQTVAMTSRINQLEDTIALQSRTSQQAMDANQTPTGSESFRGLQVPQSFAPLSHELNGADVRALSAKPSGTSSASHMDSEMLQRTGAPQAGLKAVPERDKLMMLSGDEFVKELFGEKSLDPSPVGRMHSQSPPPMTLHAQSSPTSALETQVALMSSQLNVLANAVQGIVKHASSGRADKPRSSGKPPSSPGPSSSSSSNLSGKNSKDKEPGKGGSDGGDSSPGGSPSGSGASSPSRSPIDKEGIDAYALEKKLTRVKAYESLKLPTLPKNASEAWTFKNGMFNVICKLAKADEAPAFKWVSRCAKPDADLSDSSPYPVLDRVLGSKLLEMSKNTRFAMQFQTMQEEAQKHGRQPKGRK